MISLKNFIKICSVILSLCLSLQLISCGSPPGAEEVVARLCKTEADLPMGTLYSSEAHEGAQNYLSHDILFSAYLFTKDFKGICSAAVWLSSQGYPCEFAVFFCESNYAAEDVALFCHNRLEILNRYAREAADFCGMSYDDYASQIRNASVLRSGRYAALIISSDPDEAKRTFFSAI